MENPTLNDKVREMRENGKSHDYIMGYLDGIFETLKEQRKEIMKDILENLQVKVM
jgi:NifB/MoaA-like Fe-S oxidoreductase